MTADRRVLASSKLNLRKAPLPAVSRILTAVQGSWGIVEPAVIPLKWDAKSKHPFVAVAGQTVVDSRIAVEVVHGFR